MLTSDMRRVLADLLVCKDHEVVIKPRAQPGSRVVGVHLRREVAIDSAWGSDAGAWLALVTQGLLAPSARDRLRLTPEGVAAARTFAMLDEEAAA